MQGRCIPDLYDLYDLAHVAGWERNHLLDVGHVSWAESVLMRGMEIGKRLAERSV